jgi:hypothetical protein
LVVGNRSNRVVSGRFWADAGEIGKRQKTDNNRTCEIRDGRDIKIKDIKLVLVGLNATPNSPDKICCPTIQPI